MKDTTCTARNETHSFIKRDSSFYWKIAVTLCGIVGLIASVFIHKRFYYSNSCEMTFSAYRFLEIPLLFESPGSNKNTNNAHKYKLWQFFDSRDSRFYTRKNKEMTLGHPVLYIHGHWGSYEQSRSLGAHGINLTLKSEQQQQHPYLFYDVYALDFHREGGAIHAYRLWEQAAMVEHAVQTIVHRYQLQSNSNTTCNDCSSPPIPITIVAHSIGGMVARAAFLHLPYYVTRHVSTIITLATPHTAFPIRIMDESIYTFYNSVNSYWKNHILQTLSNLTMLSISGGYKDEMIHPTLCDLDDIFVWNTTTTTTSSILASKLGVYNTSHDGIFGMDHQAIVWCHNLLTAVRDIILLLINTNTTANILVQNDTSFTSSLREADQNVKRQLGSFGKIALEAGHLYNVSNVFLFFCSFCYLCAVQEFLWPGRTYNNLFVFETIGLALLLLWPIRSNFLVSFSAIILNAIWAQMIRWFFLLFLPIDARKKHERRSPLSFANICTITLIMEAILIGFLTNTSSIQLDWITIRAFFFIYYVYFLVISSLCRIIFEWCCDYRIWNQSDITRRKQNTLLLIPATLLLLFGKFTYAVSLLTPSRGRYAQLDQGYELFLGSSWILFPVVLRNAYCFIRRNNVQEAEPISSSKAKRSVSYYLLFYMFLLTCLSFRQKIGSQIVASFLISSVAIIELLI